MIIQHVNAALKSTVPPNIPPQTKRDGGTVHGNPPVGVPLERLLPEGVLDFRFRELRLVLDERQPWCLFVGVCVCFEYYDLNKWRLTRVKA